MDRINVSELLLIFPIVIFLLPSALAIPSDWWGNVTIISGSTTNTSTDGAIIATLANNATLNYSIQVGSNYDIVGTPTSGYYLVHVDCSIGQKVKFQVYGVNASPTNLTAENCPQGGGPGIELNLLAHLVANTGTCPASYPTQPGTGNIHNGCSGGYCVHNTCRGAATFCGDGFCDSGESCSSDDSACSSGQACTNGCVATISTSSSGSTGGGGGGGAATTTPTPTPTPTPSPGAGGVSSVNIPVTGSEEKSEIIQSLSAGALGLTTLSPEEVDVTQTGEASTSTSADTQAVLNTINSALSSSTGAAQTALQEAKSQLSGGSSQTLTVQVKLEVFEVKARSTGQKTAVSKITLSFSANTNKQNVRIIEVIPKSVASSASSVKFIGEAPQILQADPVVQWSFAEVPAGTGKDLSYTVNKNLTSISTTTVATSAVPAPQPACQSGSHTCVDGQTLGTCRSDGSGYDQTPCSYGCESGACTSQPAPPPLPPQEFPWLMIVIIIIIVVVVIALVAATRRKKTYSFGKR